MRELARRVLNLLRRLSGRRPLPALRCAFLSDAKYAAIIDRLKDAPPFDAGLVLCVRPADLDRFPWLRGRHDVVVLPLDPPEKED